MNISIKWLKKYIDFEGISAEEIANKLTMSTVEVEEVRPLAKQLDNVFVGKVEKIKTHPNADKLKTAEVDLNTEKVKVVCGGSNLRKNMLVALAKPGAMIKWHGEGEAVKLKPAEIRGEKSQGMICSADEIGLENIFSHEFGQILELNDETLTVGEPLAKALELDDQILDIDNKSLTNRPDLWGHYGIARELAAILEKELAQMDLQKIKEGKEFNLKLKVQEPKICPAYFGVALSGIKIGQSPDWLKNALQAVGQKSINNIVDLTNYVMLEMGQPIHAFDADKLKSLEIHVREAEPGEKLITLDGENRNLTEKMLVIADKEKPIALAGVIGGQNSEITDSTENIVIESANFNPVNIRKTSVELGVRTDASIRFEKGLDPTNAGRALQRMVELILQTQPEAKVGSKTVSFEKYKLDLGPIKLDKDFVDKRIGQKIEEKQVENILRRLGFSIKDKKEFWEVKVPTWRSTGDIGIKEDLIEEIARIYGYDNISENLPEFENQYKELNKQRFFERKTKDFLIYSRGLTEVCNHSFAKPAILDLMNMDYSNHWQLENPWDENENLMRKNLWPALVMNVKQNLRFYDNVKIFELGRVFLQQPGDYETEPGKKAFLPKQPYFLAGAYLKEGEEMPFYQARETVKSILKHYDVNYSLSLPKEIQYFQHPNRTVLLEIKDKEIGWISELHPLIAKKLEINEKMSLWQLNFTELVENIEKKHKYKPVSKYPEIVHDISLVVDDKVLYKDIVQIIKSVDPDIIKKIDLIDIFKNGKIKKGKKSITLRITYQSDQRTLAREEAEKIQKKAILQLQKALGAELRQ